MVGREYDIQAIVRVARLTLTGFGTPPRAIAYRMLVGNETPISTGQILTHVREELAPDGVPQSTMSLELDRLRGAKLVERVHYGIYSASIFGREFYPSGLKLIRDMEAIAKGGNPKSVEETKGVESGSDQMDPDKLIEAIRQWSTPKGLIDVIATATRRLEEVLYPQSVDHSK